MNIAAIAEERAKERGERRTLIFDGREFANLEMIQAAGENRPSEFLQCRGHFCGH